MVVFEVGERDYLVEDWLGKLRGSCRDGGWEVLRLVFWEG